MFLELIILAVIEIQVSDVVRFKSVEVLLPKCFRLFGAKGVVGFLPFRILLVEVVQCIQFAGKFLVAVAIRNLQMVLWVQNHLVVVLAVDIHKGAAEFPKLGQGHHFSVEFGDTLSGGHQFSDDDDVFPL